MNSRERLIFALDVSDKERARTLARSLFGHIGCFKIGLELFTSHPQFVEELTSGNVPVFLDLKLHDIPETVSRTAKGLNNRGIKYATVHIGDDGACVQAAVESAPEVRILGVTVLTSVKHVIRSDGLDLKHVAELVVQRARLAALYGAYGVICAGPDLPYLIQQEFSDQLKFITPGIRLPDQDSGDQERVTTPEGARKAGADMIVVGRPIRFADDPVATADEIVRRMDDCDAR